MLATFETILFDTAEQAVKLIVPMLTVYIVMTIVHDLLWKE